MEIRDRILSEAFSLFSKYGIRGVTMDQIACELGISKWTLYENFKDKNTLLSEGIEHFRKIMYEEAEEILKNTSNVIEGIYFIGKHGEQMRKRVNPLFFEDIRKFYPEIYKQVPDKSRYGEFSIMQNLITKGMNDGIFNKGLNPVLVNEFWRAIMNIFMNEENFPRDRYPQEDLLKNTIIPYLLGISTEKGKGLIHKYFEKETKL